MTVYSLCAHVCKVLVIDFSAQNKQEKEAVKDVVKEEQKREESKSRYRNVGPPPESDSEEERVDYLYDSLSDDDDMPFDDLVKVVDEFQSECKIGSWKNYMAAEQAKWEYQKQQARKYKGMYKDLMLFKPKAKGKEKE